MSKKSASLDALFEESSSNEQELEIDNKKEIKNNSPKSKGRPPKSGARQQFPFYIPDDLYFYLLDNVNLRKRSNRSFSMNDLLLEAVDAWLKKNGSPSIANIVKNHEK